MCYNNKINELSTLLFKYSYENDYFYFKNNKPYKNLIIIMYNCFDNIINYRVKNSEGENKNENKNQLQKINNNDYKKLSEQILNLLKFKKYDDYIQQTINIELTFTLNNISKDILYKILSYKKSIISKEIEILKVNTFIKNQNIILIDKTNIPPFMYINKNTEKYLLINKNLFIIYLNKNNIKSKVIRIITKIFDIKIRKEEKRFFLYNKNYMNSIWYVSYILLNNFKYYHRTKIKMYV